MIAGWVFAENVTNLMQHVAAYVGTRWDDTDQETRDDALPRTDAEHANWFDYPIAGRPDLVIFVGQDVGTDVVQVRIEGDLTEVLSARFETLLDVL